MTVTMAMINYVSPYIADSSGNNEMGSTTFGVYKTIAGTMLDKMDPGLDTSTYDYCHALLIVHLYESSLGRNSLTSHSAGDEAWTKDGTPMTSYYLTARQICEHSAPSGALAQFAAGTRCDATPLPEFRLDAAESKRYTLM